MKCAYCGNAEGPFHRDHVVPRSRGGTDSASNIVTACAKCNAEKHDRLASEWLGDKCPTEILRIEARVNKRLSKDFSKRDRKAFRHPLVGKYFHSYEGPVLQWQGQVLAVVGDSFLVQLYEWIAGSPSDQVLVGQTEMKGWKFYDHLDDMALAYRMYELRNPTNSERMRERLSDWAERDGDHAGSVRRGG